MKKYIFSIEPIKRKLSSKYSSIRAFSADNGLSDATVGAALRGVREPTIDTICKLCTALQIDPRNCFKSEETE